MALCRRGKVVLLYSVLQLLNGKGFGYVTHKRHGAVLGFVWIWSPFHDSNTWHPEHDTLELRLHTNVRLTLKIYCLCYWHRFNLFILRTPTWLKSCAFPPLLDSTSNIGAQAQRCLHVDRYVHVFLIAFSILGSTKWEGRDGFSFS